jgi:hypothetical protein
MERPQKCGGREGSELRTDRLLGGELRGHLVRLACGMTHMQLPPLTLHEFVGGNGPLFRLRIREQRSLDRSGARRQSFWST